MFEILDRASPTMRGMRHEAERTDAAVLLLGRHLDGIGTTKQVRQMQTARREVRGLGQDARAMERDVSSGMRRADRDTNGFIGRLQILRRGARDTFQELWRLARPGGMIVGMGTALGVAAQGVGALAGGVIGLAPRVADLTGALAPALTGVVGLVTAVGTGKLAFGGLSQAMSGNKQALRQLTPEARGFLRTLMQMRPLVREFRQSAQRGLFPGLRLALLDLRGASPTINRVIAQMSGRLGALASQGARRFTRPAFLRDFEQIAGQGGQLVTRGGQAIFNVVDALRHVAVAARPLTDWLSKTILGWTHWADAAARAGRESGRLGRFFDRTRESLTIFGHIIRNVWITLRNLSQDARPMGDSLWRAGERATAGWARVTGTPQSRARLTRDFTIMGRTVKEIAGLVGDLGAAIFRMGASPQLPGTVHELRGLVPVLERLLNGMANTFGPPMARALMSFGTLVTDLVGASGPFVSLLNVLNSTFNILDSIIRHAGPLKSVFTGILSTALIARYLVKLGLLERGWWRVAAAAGAAGRAEAVATGVGGGGGGGFLGPVLRGRAGGARGGLRGLFRRGAPAAETGTMADFATGTAFGRAGATAGRVGAGALLGRAALGAGRFLGPLALISGGIGALTAPRSGGFVNQLMQTDAGVLNGLTFGGFTRGLDALGLHASEAIQTPEQRAQRFASADARKLQDDLRRAGRTPGAVARLQAQLSVLTRHIDSIQDRTTQASQQYLAQLQEETRARRELLHQIQLERQQRGTARATRQLGDYNQAYRLLRQQGLSPAAAMAQIDQTALSRVNEPGRTASYRRTTLGGLLASEYRAAHRDPSLMPVYNQLRQAATQTFQAHGHNYVVGPRGRIFSGGRQEWAQIVGQLGMYSEQLREQRAGNRLTTVQQMAVASLMAQGMTAQEARRAVLAIESGTPARMVVRHGGTPAGARGPIGFASGGRIPGQGLQDTVPVGGYAAPGELVVNRHTERKVNYMLAGHGKTLGGLVDDEGMRQSDRFARGGRPKRELPTRGAVDQYGLQPGITTVGDVVLNRFPGLSVTSTTGGTHAANSYHYRRMAIDLGGSVGLMNSAAAWIARTMAASLLEGIHNPGLSVKNGQRVAPGFWGATTWAGHLNHIHLAAGQVGRIGGAGAATGGGGTTVPTVAAVRLNPRGMNIVRLTRFSQEQQQGLGLMGLGGGLGAVHAAAAGAPGAGQTGAPGSQTPVSQTPVGGGGGAGTSGTNQALARRMMLRRWGPGEWSALRTLWTGESNFSATARNPSSNAQGIPQFLPMPGRATPRGFPDNPPISATAQIGWGLNYIGSRYGSPSRALGFWQSHHPHWYGKGGRTPRFAGWFDRGLDRTFDGPTLIGVGEKRRERVRVEPEGAHGRRGAHVTMTNTIHQRIDGGDPEKVKQATAEALAEFASLLERGGLNGAETDVT